MTRTSMAALVVSLITVAGVAAYTQADVRTEREVLRTLHASDEAADRQDEATLARLTADEYLWHASTGIVQTKEQSIAEAMAGGSTWNVRKYDGLEVRLYGDIAIVTGTFSIEGTSTTYDAGPRLVTRIFIRRDGRWQDLGGQATLKPPT